MEVGLIKQFEKYSIDRDIPEVYRILTDPGLKELNHTELSSSGVVKLNVFGGRGIFIVLQVTETGIATDGFFEAHKDFADVHVPLEGDESIGYTPLDSRAVPGGPIPVYDASKSDDITYAPFKSDGEMTVIRLIPGMYAWFDPDDVHMPRLQTDGPSHLKKIVIKVPLGSLPPISEHLREVIAQKGSVLETLLEPR